MKTCLIFLSFFAILINVYAGCRSGFRDISTDQLNKTFARVFNNPKVYKEGGCCNINVMRLYNKFKEDFPELEQNDFHIIFITSNKWIFNKKRRYYPNYDERPFFTPTNSRETPNPTWVFHVVLEYDGKIYDLDYTANIKAISKTEFYENQLKDGKRAFRDDFVVFRIIGEDYLDWSERHIDSESYIRELALDRPGMLTLSDYISMP